MSTEVPFARRFPLEKLHEFMEFARSRMMKRVVKIVKGLMESVDPKVIKERLEKIYNKPKSSKELLKHERRIRYQIVEDWLRHKIEDSKLQQPIYDFNCGWDFYIHDGEVFATPWGLPGFYTKLRYPEWAVDYSYWDNTDMPKGMKMPEWSERKIRWDKIFEKDYHSANCLQFAVFDMSFNHSHISTLAMMRALRLITY